MLPCRGVPISGAPRRWPADLFREYSGHRPRRVFVPHAKGAGQHSGEDDTPVPAAVSLRCPAYRKPCRRAPPPHPSTANADRVGTDMVPKINRRPQRTERRIPAAHPVLRGIASRSDRTLRSTNRGVCHLRCVAPARGQGTADMAMATTCGGCCRTSIRRPDSSAPPCPKGQHDDDAAHPCPGALHVVHALVAQGREIT